MTCGAMMDAKTPVITLTSCRTVHSPESTCTVPVPLYCSAHVVSSNLSLPIPEEAHEAGFARTALCCTDTSIVDTRPQSGSVHGTVSVLYGSLRHHPSSSSTLAPNYYRKQVHMSYLLTYKSSIWKYQPTLLSFILYRPGAQIRREWQTWRPRFAFRRVRVGDKSAPRRRGERSRIAWARPSGWIREGAQYSRGRAIQDRVRTVQYLLLVSE